jgi:hypothetical protein
LFYRLNTYKPFGQPVTPAEYLGGIGVALYTGHGSYVTTQLALERPVAPADIHAYEFIEMR